MRRGIFSNAGCCEDQSHGDSWRLKARANAYNCAYVFISFGDSKSLAEPFMLNVATSERCAASRSMRVSVTTHARKTYVERRADTGAHGARMLRSRESTDRATEGMEGAYLSTSIL
jgi:hypothetical protein